MSLSSRPATEKENCVPRASGDEPKKPRNQYTEELCSPRERG